jgi:hypothetical protein
MQVLKMYSCAIRWRMASTLVGEVIFCSKIGTFDQPFGPPLNH